MPTHEKPIIFSSPMVRAILDGRKTQTRRVVKNQPGPTTCGYTELLPGHFKPIHSLREFVGDIGSEDHKKALDEFWADENNETLTSPYGVLGDRLWVRETWKPTRANTGIPGGVDGPRTYIRYRADDSRRSVIHSMKCRGADKEPWHPSIFMPRRVSRLTLEITGIRAERLQAISEEDVDREGFTPEYKTLAIWKFRHLWDSINAKRGHGWDANPWVWIISFRRIP